MESLLVVKDKVRQQHYYSGLVDKGENITAKRNCWSICDLVQKMMLLSDLSNLAYMEMSSLPLTIYHKVVFILGTNSRCALTAYHYTELSEQVACARFWHDTIQNVAVSQCYESCSAKNSSVQPRYKVTHLKSNSKFDNVKVIKQ